MSHPALALPVIPSDMTTEERDSLPHVIWNTRDDFDLDEPSYRPIFAYHRALAVERGEGHWFIPNHESLCLKSFKTERDAAEILRKSHKF